RSDSRELEGAERLVVAGELALALEDLDSNRRLVVVCRGEGLAALGRNGRVALDELGHHAALGLDTEAQRGDIDEQHVLALTLEDTSLQGGADGDDLVGVDTLVGVLAGL